MSLVNPSSFKPLQQPVTPAQNQAVSVQNISRDYDGAWALDRVSLDIRRGEFFSLLGPSGCGKTTLLRIIGGFVQPTSGDLHINGQSVLHQSPHLRRTNMVFQDGALFPHLSVEQNIAFGLEMKRTAKQEIKKRTADALEMVRLEGYGKRRIDQLSGGQRQRVALARALVNRPEVLLLDEPLSALDLQLRLQMQSELRRLQRETGGTFIFVTHDQGEAITMSDRLAVMQGGRILQAGTPREVYEHPNRQFVAEFMGHSNILWGTISKLDAELAYIRCGDLEIAGRLAQQAQVGDRAMFALRYEKVALSPDVGGAAGLRGVVVSEDYMGATIRREIRIGGDVTLVSELSNTISSSFLDVGSSVVVSWPSHAPSVLLN